MSEFLCSRYDNLEPYVPGEQPKDKQYIKLNANETSVLPSPNVMKMLKSNRMDKLGFYGDPDAIELRKALAERYDVDIDEILDIFSLIVKAFTKIKVISWEHYNFYHYSKIPYRKYIRML